MQGLLWWHISCRLEDILTKVMGLEETTTTWGLSQTRARETHGTTEEGRLATGAGAGRAFLERAQGRLHLPRVWAGAGLRPRAGCLAVVLK